MNREIELMIMKLCLIYNFAQHYRTNIFTLMDKEMNVDFVFGDTMGDVKKMDYSLLRHSVMEVGKIKIGHLTYQKKVVSLLRKNYTHYLILPDTRCISSWLFLLISRFYSKKKVYIWTHGWYGKESGIEKILKKIMFRLPNGGVFLYGNYARELMIKDGFNPDKLYTIHNSLAYDKQIEIRKELKATAIYKNHFGNDNKNLFFIGRLTPVKRLDLILRALAICRDRSKNYNFTFIGDGEKTNELMALTKELGLESHIWFYGSCYDEVKLSSLIYNADLCVAPGNIGLTAMHSMVFGTPCITHNDFKWQMPEFEAIKEGVTGTFFKRDDVVDLANKIDAWFAAKIDSREDVRNACMKEIDEQWNPYFQINVLKKNLK